MVNQKSMQDSPRKYQSIIPHDRVFPRSLVTTNILILILILIHAIITIIIFFFPNPNILSKEPLNLKRPFKVVLKQIVYPTHTPRPQRHENRPRLLRRDAIILPPNPRPARSPRSHRRLSPPRLPPILRDAGRPDARRRRRLRRRPLPAPLTTTTPSSVAFRPRLLLLLLPMFSVVIGGAEAGIPPPPLLLPLVLPMSLPPFRERARDDSHRRSG